MNAEDVLKVHQAVPEATLISSHMEAVNHCVLSRAELRKFAQKSGMTQQLLIPEDNEVCSF